MPRNRESSKMIIDYPSLWSNPEAEAITGGVSNMPWSAYGICLKERDIQPGDLFFASHGDDLEFAFEHNAAAIVIPASMIVAQHIEANYPIMRVPCAFEALRTLARASRFRTHSLVVAVQGFEQRRSFTRAIEMAADVYEGDRHLSSSVAAMPELCDFSIFGTSPSLRPDVLIIDKCGQIKDHGVIDAMPDNGILLVNIDDECSINVIARARAAGLRNILTYGQNTGADARFSGQITADDGVQMTCSILGQDIAMHAATAKCPHMPTLSQSPNMLLAALLLAKLSDIKIQRFADDMAAAYMSPFSLTEDQPDTGIKLFAGAVKKSQQSSEAIFRVRNLIDVGNGSRTLVLDQGAPGARETDFELPARLNGLDVVCASKKISVFKNARAAVERMFSAAPLRDIVPDVLCPGDYVVFKSAGSRTNSVFSSALRVQNIV